MRVHSLSGVLGLLCFLKHLGKASDVSLENGVAGWKKAWPACSLFLQGECGQELSSIFVSQFGFAAEMGLFQPC